MEFLTYESFLPHDDSPFYIPVEGDRESGCFDCWSGVRHTVDEHNAWLSVLRPKGKPTKIGLTGDQGAVNKLIHQYKRGARNRKYTFSLTEDQFREITSSNCHYCGVPPSQVIGFPRPYIYNGIDRVDSKRGYEFDNCVPCCKTCNFAKGTLTTQEFYEWVDRLVAYRLLTK